MRLYPCTRRQGYGWLRQDSISGSLFLISSVKFQKHISSQELQSSTGMVTAGNLVTSDDESYTKNALGGKLDFPECVKVLGGGGQRTTSF